MDNNNEQTTSNEGRSPDVGTSAWFAVFCCAYKLDIGNDTPRTETPNAIFKYRGHAEEYAKRWPTTAEVRPMPLYFDSANVAAVEAGSARSRLEKELEALQEELRYEECENEGWDIGVIDEIKAEIAAVEYEISSQANTPVSNTDKNT